MGLSVVEELVSGADDFAARLLLALNAFNLSRGQFSAALGVDKSLVSRWLSGQVTPSGYNLARISAEFARRKPGFNMTLWTAPRVEFEVALGLAPATSERATRPTEPVSGAANLEPSRLEATPAKPFRRPRWNHAALAATGILVVIFAGWLLWNARIARDAASPQAARSGISSASVAILPFLNMSGDPAKDYLGDGISEEILNDLSNTPELRVAARTSSFSFRNKSADIGEIAHKLHVRSVLEGSVRQEGNRVRIVAQLIDATDGFHLWSARYDRKLDDILAVQDEIARAIVVALTQKLVPPRPFRAIEPKAYQDYLQAQFFFRQRTGSAFYRANELLKDAISRQPDFAAAYALRGHVLMLFAGEDSALQAESRQMTAEALRLEPDNRDALDTDIQRALRDWDWNRADRDGHRVLALKKHDALAYNSLGYFYQYLGFPQQALEARRQGAELDPLYFSYRRNLALTLWHVGRVQEATAAAEAALELQPDHPHTLDDLCTLSARAGRIDRARGYARQLAAQRTPSLPITDSHGRGRQLAIEQVRKALIKDCEIQIAFETEQTPQIHALLDRITSKEIGSSELGLLYARTGDLARAMKLFSEAYDQRETFLVWIRFDAATPKALLRDPRWLALWRRPLLQEWQRHHDRIAAELVI